MSIRLFQIVPIPISFPFHAMPTTDVRPPLNVKWLYALQTIRGRWHAYHRHSNGRRADINTVTSREMTSVDYETLL